MSRGDGEWRVVYRGGLFADLGHGFFGEVAAFADGPFVVGFDEHGGHVPHDGRVFGEDPDDVGAPLDLTNCHDCQSRARAVALEARVVSVVWELTGR